MRGDDKKLVVRELWCAAGLLEPWICRFVSVVVGHWLQPLGYGEIPVIPVMVVGGNASEICRSNKPESYIQI